MGNFQSSFYSISVLLIIYIARAWTARDKSKVTLCEAENAEVKFFMAAI